MLQHGVLSELRKIRHGHDGLPQGVHCVDDRDEQIATPSGKNSTTSTRRYAPTWGAWRTTENTSWA